uniref:MLX interacting protein like n=1 Tax=Anas platyrhynchos platyrhynchos TaxID=8840 RepID=U3IHQ7_ANAPP
MAQAQVGLPGPFPEPLVGSCPDSDFDSDSEDATMGGAGPGAGVQKPSQVIHSGHFMVSSPHSDSLPRRRHRHADPKAADPRSIDPTLTRLFECMSLEYSGKLVSPKWKNFKGQRLLCRDKILLGNAMWDVEQRKNPMCGFITPLEGSEADEHRKPEAVVLEGNYWKRRIEVVMREYHKWRIYYKKRLRKSSREGELSSPKQDEDAWRPTEKWCNQLFCNVVPMLLGNEEEELGGRQHFDLDTFLSDISDTLFTMTQTPSTHQALPEDAYIGNADMIQPDLAPLQPSLDDTMEISDIFISHRPLPAQTQLGYQEPPCFVTMAEPLYVGGGAVPTSPNALLPPSTLLQPGGASQLSLHGAFLSSEQPPPPLAPEPPAAVPGSLSPQLKHKPLLQYNFPGKCVSMEPLGLPYTPPSPSPGPPLLGPEPSFSPTSAPRSKFPYTASPSPSLLAHPASPLSTPCFAQHTPGIGYAVDMVPPEYPGPAAPQHLPHTTPGSPRFATPKGPSPGGSGRSKAKTGSTKAKRLPGPSIPPHLAVPNPCLTQLLTTAKQEPALDTSPAHGPSLLPASPVSPQSSVPDVPVAFLSRVAQLSPGLSPGSSPSQAVPVPVMLAGAAPGPLLVPKVERLSPTSSCGSDWPKPRQASLGPNAGLSTGISLHHPTSRRGRPESSKIESRRITHISAEQKRRFNIKLGFDTLHSLVSTLSTQPSIKVSKATTLQKTAEYICKLQQERAALQDEAQRLREQIEELNSSINLCQEQLPATGVPITRQRFDQMRSMFDEYIRSSTLQNWKFWIVSFGAGACSWLCSLHQTLGPLVCPLNPLLCPSSSRGSGDDAWWEPIEMLWLRGSFFYKGVNKVGINDQSLGKREVTSGAELTVAMQGRAPGDRKKGPGTNLVT